MRGTANSASRGGVQQTLLVGGVVQQTLLVGRGLQTLLGGGVQQLKMFVDLQTLLIHNHQVFLNNHITGPRLIELREEDLVNMNITSVGHRKDILLC